MIAAILIGYTGDVHRFATRRPLRRLQRHRARRVSSGGRHVHRLSRRGNRQLNHAIHMAAVTQIRFTHSPGRAYYDRKIAEGKTKKEALRAFKRRVSDAVYRQLVADAQRTREVTGPGGHPGTTPRPAWPAHTLINRLFGEVTARARPSHYDPRPEPSGPTTAPRRPSTLALDNKEEVDSCFNWRCHAGGLIRSTMTAAAGGTMREADQPASV